MSNSEMPEFSLLIVDNHPDQLQRWRRVSELVGGFSVIEAQSLQAALDAVEAHTVDVLVTDLFLTTRSEESEQDPEGLHLIVHCRTSFPQSRIIALTGKTGQGIEIGAEALQAGADDFVSLLWRHVNADALLEMKLRIFQRVLRDLRLVTS